MRKTATKLSKVKVNGRRLYCVTWPKVKAGRNRQHFKNKPEAETFLAAKIVEQRNYGTAGTSFDEKQRAEYLECVEKLQPFNVKLRDAVAFYLPHLEAKKKASKKTARELVTEVIARKTSVGASERYLSDLRSRLKQFGTVFNERPVGEITVSDVEQWLSNLARKDGNPLSPTTRNNFRRVLIVAFNFAKKGGYRLGNPARESAEAKEVKLAAGILTVTQAADLLTHCDAKIVPAVALGLFAGLRPESEGLHLDWSHIDFSDSTINIEPDKTKSESSARYIAMAANLVAWLAPYKQEKGRVFPPVREYYESLREARKQAGIEEWPHDALRHSFGSYHYGAHQNAALTQSLMGHTNAKIFFKHYRKPLKQSVALRYWTIQPEKAANVVTMTA